MALRRQLWRSASVGWMRSARRAGAAHASTPTTASLFFVGIVGAMACTSGRHLLAAQHLAAELGESEQRMTLAVSAAQVGIWSRDVATGRIWANGAPDQGAIFSWTLAETIPANG